MNTLLLLQRKLVPVMQDIAAVLVMVKDKKKVPIKPKFKVSFRSHVLGGPFINKLITLGGRVPLHSTVSLSPHQWNDSTMYW